MNTPTVPQRAERQPSTPSPAAPAAGKIKATHKARAGILFISGVTHRRIPLFRYRGPCQIFFENLVFYQRKYGFKLHAYVLLPNHFHLLINFPPEQALASFLRDFKSSIGIQIVDWLREKQYSQLLAQLTLSHSRKRWKDSQYAVWQRISYMTPLLNAKMIQRRLNYIHDNPRREKLAQEPDSYPWSSAGAYVGGTKPPVSVVLLTFPAD